MMLQKRNYYIKQKKIVQPKIREQMNIYEMKITNDTRPEQRKKELGII